MNSSRTLSAYTLAFLGLTAAVTALEGSNRLNVDIPARTVHHPASTPPAPSSLVPGHRQNVEKDDGSAARRVLAGLPLAFEENRGQTDPRVKFLARGPGYTLFLTSSEAVFSLTGPATHSADGGAKIPEVDPFRSIAGRSVLRMKVVGGHAEPVIEGVERLAGRINYFKGTDPRRWQQDVPTYGRVRYEDIYAGVDLVYYGKDGALEYDFEVAPGADASLIRLAFDGATDLRVERTGDLTISTNGGDVRLQKPVLYQQRDGHRDYVSGSYVIDATHRSVTFRIGPYDHQRRLVIDPVLLYSTYLGGGDSDTGTDLTLDANGNIYVTGYTTSLDFPIASAMQPQNGGGNSDLFVAKMNPSGTALMYSTYFGDGGGDAGMGITVDANGNAYVAGLYAMPPSWSQLALVAKFGPTGLLVYGSVWGTGFGDVGYAVAVDPAGYAYVTGKTGAGSNFPTTADALQPSWGGFEDAFLSVLNPTGTTLEYSTYLGGWLEDEGRAIALGRDGNVYVAGGTMGGFPTTPGAFQRQLGGFGDAFVVKINPRLSGTASLLYSTLLGGSDFEVAFSLALDDGGNAYVTGSTDSGFDFPVTAGAFQTLGGGGNCGTFERPRHCQDAFVTKLNATASGLVYSTFLGGLGHDFGNGIAVDRSGSAYVVGQAFAADFPVWNAVQAAKASGCCTDGFVTKLTPTGNGLVYSTYLGGASDDFVSDVAVDSAGNAYVIGAAQSADFPLFNPLQPLSRGNGDAFVAKIGEPACTFSITPTNRSLPAAAATGTISVTASSAPCAWSAASAAGWITVTSGSSGTGNGSVGYAVTANAATTSRVGTITVAGQTFTVTQAGAMPAIGLTVTSPNGGEKLYTGSSYRIDWTAAGSIARFDVESSADNVTWTSVSGCSALAGTARSCTWTTPGPAGANARIRVTARDAGGAAVSDLSNAAFTIATGTPSITVTFPNSAINVGIGSLQQVKWNHTLGANAYVKVDLSRDGGVTYTEVLSPSVKSGTSSSGTFAWRVGGPATAGAMARIRVTALNTPATDVSNVNFTIAPVFLTMSAPGAGANWGFGTTQRPTWSTNLGALDLVNVEFSATGSGGPFAALPGAAGIVANKQLANVVAPGTASTTARLRVVWANPPAGSTAQAISPADFKLQPPFISLGAPAAGQTWTIGGAATVTWSHNLGAFENIKIELSKDNGASYPVVVLASTPSDGSQGMTVQAAWGAQSITRLKLTWVKNTSTVAQSAAFTIRP